MYIKRFNIIVLMDKDHTTIKVSKKLTNKLKELGSKGESYEDVIWRLIVKK
jgi:predicted CopG family antitoxin